MDPFLSYAPNIPLMASKEVKPLPVSYSVLYLGVFLLFSWGILQFPSGWIEQLTARISSDVFNIFGVDSKWSLVNGFSRLTMQGEKDLISVTIIKECTAINVFGVVAGLIIPLRYSSSWNKIRAITLSAAILFLMNISRIMLTVYLTGYSVPPFSWYFQNPTVETYHYPISFAYGVIGVALLILIVNKWVLPELGDTLLGISMTISDLPKLIKNRKRVTDPSSPSSPSSPSD